MHKLFKIFLLIIIFYSASVLVIGLIKSQTSISSFFELKKTQKLLEQTIKNLEEENQKISSEITKIKTSSDYAQKVLKDKYHFTNKNEKILFVEEN